MSVGFMFPRLLLCVCIFAVTMGSPVFSQSGAMKEVSGKVTYVTSTVVYGDLGRRHGLREGDTVVVMKEGTSFARLLVTNLASKSFSADILQKSGAVVKEDVVRAIVPEIVIPPHPQLIPDSSTAAISVVARPERRNAPARSVEQALELQLRGRIALQYYALYNSQRSGAAFSQPAAVVNLTADNLAQLPLRFQYYSNHRYDARSDAARTGVTRERWRNRFYQFSLAYGSESDPINATVGRFVPYAVGGIGTVDGAMLVTRSKGWEAGVLAGAQPGYQNTELSLRDQKYAVYTGYRSEGELLRIRSSAAFAQTYRDGALDRGYFYLVNTLAVGRDLTLYQNASVDLYDVDEGSGMFQPHVSDLYLSATWRPQRWMSWTGSYANRRSVYFLRSFSTVPDSLFLRARLQNYQINAGFNIPGGMYAAISASLRTQENSDQAATSLAGRFTWSNFLSSQSNVYVLGSWSDNIFSTSTSYGVEVNRDLLEGLYSALRLQQYQYTYSQGARSVQRTTLSVETYYRMSRMFYLSLSYERYWEASITNDRVYTEVSMRLR